MTYPLEMKYITVAVAKESPVCRVGRGVGVIGVCGLLSMHVPLCHSEEMAGKQTLSDNHLR